MLIFKAFQLIIATEIFFPELLELVNNDDLKIDVVIRYGLVSAYGLDSPVQMKPNFHAKPGLFWLNIANVARFLVVDGKEITIEPYADVDEDSIRLFILGSCFGALLMQRGYYLLHGNAVQVGDCAVSFVGLSGAGKSTMSGMLLKRGYSIVADDVCAINAFGEVLPSFPQIKLMADAAQNLAFDVVKLRKVRSTLEKYAVPLGDKFSVTALPLKMVYVLNPTNNAEISIRNITGVQKCVTLQTQAYRRLYVEGLVTKKVYSERCLRLSERIELANVQRPMHGYYFADLIACIEKDLTQRGLLQDVNYVI